MKRVFFSALLTMAMTTPFLGGASEFPYAEISASPRVPLIANLPQFYRPNVIYEDGIYKMWTTSGDRIRYFTSSNGVNWSGGNTVFAASTNHQWELDGGEFEGYKGGISDPKIVSGAIYGWKYAMFYTAGTAPNREGNGGLGLAFSNDGQSWVRSSNNPIRTFPGGNAFAIQAMEIRGKYYFYFFGGGDAARGIPPELRVAEILSNGTLAPDRVLTLGGATYPLVYDPNTDKCFFAEDENVDGVPQNIKIYYGSDCFTNIGTIIGKVGKNDTTNIYNFGGALKERSSKGHLIRTGTTELIFSSGNQWGNWQAGSASWIGKVPPTTSAGTTIPFVKVTSNNILSGWSAENVIDGRKDTAYSSNRFNSSANNSGTLVAAWFANFQTISKVILQARISGNKPLGFPARYQVYITNSNNTAWVDKGVFSKQPDANGKVEIDLLGNYSTMGLMIRPIEYGKDDFGSYYFQLVEMGLNSK